jgi:hypothetical protein
MDSKLVEKIKCKKEFSGLPDPIVERALVLCDGDFKETRAFLRKYFGVFLTNKVLKGKGDLLKFHISSKKRDYKEFYRRIFDEIGGGNAKSVIDLGSGVNGFSYSYLPEGIEYVGVEAVKQVVENLNIYFKKENFCARAVWLDIFDVFSVLEILKKAKRPRAVFMFQIVDALEVFERDFSKRFILEVMDECEWLILSLPTESLSGKSNFAVKRKWLIDFLSQNFFVRKDYEVNGERILIVEKTNN